MYVYQVAGVLLLPSCSSQPSVSFETRSVCLIVPVSVSSPCPCASPLRSTQLLSRREAAGQQLLRPDNRRRPPGATLRPCTRAQRHQSPSLTHPAPCADRWRRPGRVWGKASNHKKHCRKNLHTAIVAGWRTPRFSAHAPSDQVACPRHDKVPPQHGKCLRKLTCPRSRSACKSGVRRARQHALAHGVPSTRT
jgi:hypothetical protein